MSEYAEHALAALEAAHEGSTVDADVSDMEESMADLFADLLHLAREHELDFDFAILSGRRHFYAEVIGEDK